MNTFTYNRLIAKNLKHDYIVGIIAPTIIDALDIFGTYFNYKQHKENWHLSIDTEFFDTETELNNWLETSLTDKYGKYNWEVKHKIEIAEPIALKVDNAEFYIFRNKCKFLENDQVLIILDLENILRYGKKHNDKVIVQYKAGTSDITKVINGSYDLSYYLILSDINNQVDILDFYNLNSFEYCLLHFLNTGEYKGQLDDLAK